LRRADLATVGSVTLSHPYVDLVDGRWYKGSLHVHSDVSVVDVAGQRPREQILADYRSFGHDFVMFAEQNRYTTQAEIDADGLNDHGLIVIPGAELDDRCFVSSGQHVSHVNPSDGCHVIEKCALTDILTYVARDEQAFVVLLHPNLPGFDRDATWVGLTALEVVSGFYLRRPGHESPFAFDAWDHLLGQGARVWGIADDCSFAPGDIDVAWLQVFATECSVPAIVEAVRAGRFYASTGVTIDGIEVDGATVTITAPDAAHFAVVVDGGERTVVADGPVATYEVGPEATFVRFECIGADDTWGSDYGERWTAEHVLRRAWTQPMWVCSRADDIAADREALSW
jgi:hypothetical protein